MGGAQLPQTLAGTERHAGCACQPCCALRACTCQAHCSAVWAHMLHAPAACACGQALQLAWLLCKSPMGLHPPVLPCRSALRSDQPCFCSSTGAVPAPGQKAEQPCQGFTAGGDLIKPAKAIMPPPAGAAPKAPAPKKQQLPSIGTTKKAVRKHTLGPTSNSANVPAPGSGPGGGLGSWKDPAADPLGVGGGSAKTFAQEQARGAGLGSLGALHCQGSGLLRCMAPLGALVSLPASGFLPHPFLNCSAMQEEARKREAAEKRRRKKAGASAAAGGAQPERPGSTPSSAASADQASGAAVLWGREQGSMAGPSPLLRIPTAAPLPPAAGAACASAALNRPRSARHLHQLAH